ncbi:MAG TPA: hypothetical protein PKC18_09790, partial [Lacipirellulaceae bacterium]|nr:hypothetical protein [Lacipirellulaceae bacterium]
MTSLVDTTPDVDVAEQEYVRLLGYPAGHALDGRARELADWARSWYAVHGRPRMAVRWLNDVAVSDGQVHLEGRTFQCPPVAQTWSAVQANEAVLAAVTAGPEIEAAAAEAWADQRPDEYFFLEAFGSAVVERLVTVAGARICAWADGRKRGVTPHYSPGYPGWDVSQQQRLLEVLSPEVHGLGGLETLESGMLRPKKSLLALFGLTPHQTAAEWRRRSPCTGCSYHPCQFRREPYRGPAVVAAELAAVGAAATSAALSTPLDCGATYSVNNKALNRWARERLTLDRRSSGAVVARFRYDGTTCTNMGRPLAFEYTVELGPASDGYPVLRQSCTPAEGDRG